MCLCYSSFGEAVPPRLDLSRLGTSVGTFFAVRSHSRGMVGHTEYDYGGESAVVTGSTAGIGRGVAAALAETDANVVVNCPTESEVESVAAELDELGVGTVTGVAADVGDPAAVDRLVERAIDAFGGIDLLVNNAAVCPEEGSFVESDIEGCIVNVTSQAGDRRTDSFGLYGISKTPITGVT